MKHDTPNTTPCIHAAFGRPESLDLAMNALFFWFFSIAMIVCGLAVILNRNPVASAICFAFTIIFMSALFVMLNAFFLAAVQILVTAGAVMVLFLFIIMLLDISGAEKVPRQRIWMGCARFCRWAFFIVVALTLNATPEGRGPHQCSRWRPPTALPADTEGG